MRFAIVDNNRVPAQPKLKGLCPGCSKPVIAKCGTRRIWHWAHSADTPCADRWWEPETAWHRAWKDEFPLDWQEYIQHDPKSGEKHIADVRTSHTLVLEFQHSHLDPQERAARERFYQNMIWIVDGTRLKRTYTRFVKGIELWAGRITEGHPILIPHPDECFPADWCNSPVPIVFDFKGSPSVDPEDRNRDLLWWLLPGRAGNHAVIQAMSRQTFIKLAHNHPALHLEARRVVAELDMRQRNQSHPRMVVIPGRPLYRQQPRRGRRSRF